MAHGEQQVRWGRIAGVTVLGGLFAAAPFVLAWHEPKFGDWHLICSTTLTNIGTSILLVGIVFFLERGLVKRVSQAAAQSTAEVVDERTQELRTANQALATQLANLRAEFEGTATAVAEEQTAPLRNLATDVSFDSVAEALETVNGFGALQGGNVVVPLRTPSDAPELLSFDWRLQELRSSDWMGTDEYVAAIRVTYLATRSPSGGPGTPVVEVLWRPREKPAKMLLNPKEEMVRRGFGEEAKLVGPDLFAHVGTALSEAVAGGRADDGAWVQGEMYEWLADGWAVTDQGLISRDHGSIPRADFPRNHGVPSPRQFRPALPDGVSEPFWRFAVDRAHGPLGHGPTSLAAAQWAGDRGQAAFTLQTTPRKQPGWPPAA